MRALASLPWWILLLGALALCFATVAGSRWVGRRLYGDDPMRAGGLAATLTAVFGALFAFLSGFLITTEWTQHTSAEGAVANEAAAAARLAWAADTPGVDQAKVHDAVHRYLDVSVQQDWEAMSHGLPDALPSDGTYREVERTGPHHDPHFRVAVTLPGLEPAEGVGGYKRAAEKSAALAMLAREVGGKYEG